MDLGRKTFSTRLVVGILVMVAMALVCSWSYVFDFRNKVLSWGTGLPIILPFVWWSWREIFKLERHRLGRRAKWYSCMWCLVTLIPQFILLGNAEDVTNFSKSMLGYAILGLVAILFFVVLWGRWTHKNVTWLDRDEWLKYKSFVCLMSSAILFWNVVLIMVICSLWYWIAFLFVVVALNDCFAYAVGRRFGKRKISSYSPNKTWEGLLSSSLIVYVGMVLFWIWIPDGIRKMFVGEQWFPLLILGIPFLIVCHLGDLQFSMHKRIFGIKDYSGAMGQHGGFWDRFDSHTFAFVFWGVCALVWQAAIR